MTGQPARLLTSDYHRALLASMLNLGMTKHRIAHALGIELRTLRRLLNGSARAKYPLQCLMESLLPAEIVELHKQRYLDTLPRTSYWEREMESKGYGTGN